MSEGVLRTVVGMFVWPCRHDVIALNLERQATGLKLRDGAATTSTSVHLCDPKSAERRLRITFEAYD